MTEINRQDVLVDMVFMKKVILPLFINMIINILKEIYTKIRLVIKELLDVILQLKYFRK